MAPQITPEDASVRSQNSPVAPLPLWAHALDVLGIAALILGAIVLVHGGFIVHPAGIRISLKSAWRPLAWAAGLLLLRHALKRRPPVHESTIGRLMAAGRAYGVLPDDLELLGHRGAGPRTLRGRHRGLAVAAVLLFYVVFTAVMTYPQVRQMQSVSIDIGDPLLSTWRLSWFAHQILRDPVHLFDANIFYPETRTLAYSDAMLVPSLTIAPLVWAGVHQVIAYNVLLLSGFAFSGAAMFLLVRYLTGHSGAALVAGFVFAFLPYRFMHYAHLELQMAQWMPLCLWAFHRTVNEGRLRDGVMTGLFLALQTLSSWYYGIFFTTFLVPVGGAILIGAGHRRAMRAIRPLAAGAIVTAMLVAPAAVPYFGARESVGERPESEIQFYSASPRNYLAAHSSNVLLGGRTASLGGQERELFEGITVVALALVGLWRPLSAARIGYALGLLLAFEISLGFNGLVYGWLHEYALPYRGLRVPARMGIVVGLALAILGGYGIARICRTVRNRSAAGLVCAALVAMVFFEDRVSLELRYIWPTPSPAYAAIPASPSTVVLNLPLIVPDVTLEPVYMYFSTFHWHTMVNGYSGFSPPSYLQLLDVMHGFPDEQAFAELRRRSVAYVIVHGAFYRLGIYNRLIEQLDARQDLRLVGTYQWARRETRVYQLLARSP